MLCHEMHWDYFTYLRQPTWFIVTLQTKLRLEAIYQNRMAKQNKRSR